MSTAHCPWPATFQDAWHRALNDLLAHGHEGPAPGSPWSPGSGFGQVPRRLIERLGAVVGFTNPRARLVTPPACGWNLPYALANVLWTLGGRNDLEMIAAYNARGRAFSDDGQVLRGAYGPRWMLPGPHGEAPRIHQVLHELRADPSSRRTVLPVFEAQDLLAVSSSRDVPCALGLQALVRHGRLSVVVHMRSQSAALVMPYDVVLFSVVQEVLATELGLDLGEHLIMAGSLHLHADELPQIQAWREAPPRPVRPWPAMPAAPLATLPRVLAWEERLRRGMADAGDLAQADLPAYWIGWLAVLGWSQQPSHEARAAFRTMIPSCWSLWFDASSPIV